MFFGVGVHVVFCILLLFVYMSAVVNQLPRFGEERAFSFFLFLPLRLNPRGGRQTGIPVYQVLKGVS